MSDNEKKLTEAIIKIVKHNTRCEKVDAKSSMENLPQWDSLAYMSILSEIEITFEIEINEDNIRDFNSIESILNVLKKIIK